MHPILAIRAFFWILFGGEAAKQAMLLLKGEVSPAALPAPAAPATAAKPAVQPKPASPPKPKRSDAVNLLAALQREARLVDFLQEPIADYSDAQVGAAVRDVHRECGKVLERMFGIEPLQSEAEGAEIDVPKGFDAGCLRLVGNVQGEGPFRGRLAHPGWKVSRCEIPVWSGSDAAAKVVAPAEVELG